jgi:hypothetical protein
MLTENGVRQVELDSIRKQPEQDVVADKLNERQPVFGLLRPASAQAAYWTLDTLAEAAQQMGIEVGRSQVKHILLAEGVRWRNTRPWTESAGPEFVPKGLMDRRTLHQPTAQLHGGLRRRARSHHPWALPSGSGMVAGWAPHL